MLTAFVIAAAAQAAAAAIPMQTVQVSVQGTANGRAVLDCARSAEGALSECQVTDELPKGRGFGKAGVNLAGKMKLGDGKASRVSIPIVFTAETQPENLIRDPDWIARPSGEDYSWAFPPKAKTGGQGDLNCMVDDTGGLKDCIVTDVAPLGVGFDQAVMMLAPRYKMQLKAKDGTDVAGRPVRIPLRFVLE